MRSAAQILGVTTLALAAAAPLILAAGLVHRRLSAVLATLATLAGAVAGVAAVSRSAAPWPLPVFRTGTESPSLPMEVSADATTATIALTVLGVTVAVQLFAAWYLRADERYPAFAATVSLFAAAMLLLVLSRDLILTLIGWEVMGWCSYLLIGHWSRREAPRRAAYKAFMVTRIADVAFVLGVVALIAVAGTSSIDGLVEVLSASALSAEGTIQDQAGVAMALLVIGVLGKSAQLPFQDWLTDAMEGPTPASALIHAATMVAAGTWVLSQLWVPLSFAGAARGILAVSVAATMVLAAFTAFFQTDLKRLLAWSTISQIAVMLSPLAVSEPDAAHAAVGHLFGHAIFKALLFLTVGWLAVLAGSTSARALTGVAGGSGFARAIWGAGLLSLAGVPLTVGGISKEGVIGEVSALPLTGDRSWAQMLLTVSLLLTVAMTAAYATRAYEVVAAEGSRAPGEEGTGPEVRIAAPVAVVLLVLAVASVTGGLVFVAGSALGALHSDVGLIALSVLLIGVGVVVGWYLRPDDARDPTPLMRSASRGYGADTLYVRAVAVPVLAVARLVSFLDREVVDLYVRGAGWAAGAGGDAAGAAHRRERVSTNLVWVVVGLLVLAGVALWA